MSAALSAAKKRRAPIPVEPPKLTQAPTQAQTPNNQASGLTLQQVIALIDRRLISLENPIEPDVADVEDMNEEYENRFTILVNEISELKQTILSLQTFTMDVNKALFEKLEKQVSFDL